MSAETNVGLLDLSAPIVLYTELRGFLSKYLCVCVLCMHMSCIHFAVFISFTVVNNVCMCVFFFFFSPDCSMYEGETRISGC